MLLHGFVALLISQLGHNSYLERAKASKALQPLAHVAAAQLEHAVKHHHDAEVRHRAWQIWKPLHEERVEKLAFSLREKHPWICLPDSYQEWYYREQAVKRWNVMDTGPEWLGYRFATKLYVRDRLMAGATVKEVQTELDGMAAEELEWVRRYQAPPP